MSIQLNQQFIENPKQFFRNHFINQPDALCFGTATGIQQFDFNLDPANRAVKRHRFRRLREYPVVSISQHVPAAGQAPGVPFASVPVHWLSNTVNAVTNIQLTNGADFFFTVTLNGCRIEVGFGVNPTILHIDGSHSNAHQIQLGNQYFNGAPHRGLSYVLDHGYANADNAIFYGIRNRRTNRWKFYTQGYDAVLPHSNEMLNAGFIGTIDFKKFYANKRF